MIEGFYAQARWSCSGRGVMGISASGRTKHGAWGFDNDLYDFLCMAWRTYIRPKNMYVSAAAIFALISV